MAVGTAPCHTPSGATAAAAAAVATGRRGRGGRDAAKNGDHEQRPKIIVKNRDRESGSRMLEPSNGQDARVASEGRRSQDGLKPGMSPMSMKVERFDKYSRKDGHWTWKRPSYERDVVRLAKAERKMEEGIASALTEVEAIEAGLRYFDKLIMPQTKWGPTPTPAGIDGVNPRNGPRNELRNDRPPRHLQQQQSDGGNMCDRGGNRQHGSSKGGGGFPRSEASTTNKRGSDPHKANAQSTGLKLTLKERLDNYDRQRGINISPSSGEEQLSSAPAVARCSGSNGGDATAKAGAAPSLQRVSRKTSEALDVAPHDSVGGGGVLATAPAPCEGGALDVGSVERIVARSLGNAVTAVRRQRSNDGRLNSEDSEKGGGGGGGGGDGNDRGRRPRRSKWKSWRDTPTAVLLGRKKSTGSGRVSVTGDDQDDFEPSRSKAASETSPASSLRDRKAFVTVGSREASAVSNGKKPGAHGAASNNASGKDYDCSMLGDANNVTAQAQGGDPSCLPQQQQSGRGAPLVPRVATLAIDATGSKNKNINKSNRDGETPMPAKKTKDFDPDNLECVRRHEASVAERAREAQRAREEVERRSNFRALPLPSFRSAESCGAGVGVAGAGGTSTSSGRTGRSGGKWHNGSSLAVVTSNATPRPALMSALEQDDEAKSLVERIRRVNPQADIASIVLGSSALSTTPPLTSRNSGGSAGRARQPLSARDLTPPDTGAPTAATEVVTGASTAATSTAGTLPRPEVVTQRELYPCQERGGAGDAHCSGNLRVIAEGLQGAERGGEDHDDAAAGDGGGGGGGDSVSGDGWVGGTARSLMGRMLGSGMLERQRVWAKARSRKVLETRRKIEEAKEQEGKGDILEAGFGERSWLAAKTQHQRSLERQREEDEIREHIRQARKRASAARVEREREAAERRAVAMAVTLAAAEAIGRGSCAALDSSDETGKRFPKRSRNRQRDGAIAETAAGASPLAGAGAAGGGTRQPRGEGGGTGNRGGGRGGRGGGGGEGGGGGSINIKDLSEESFYRVAVENILAREGLSADGGGVVFGDADGNGDGDGDDDAEDGYQEEAQGGCFVDNSDGNRRNVGRRPHGRRPKRSELRRKDAAAAALRSIGPRDGETGSGKLRRRRKKATAAPNFQRAGTGRSRAAPHATPSSARSGRSGATRHCSLAAAGAAAAAPTNAEGDLHGLSRRSLGQSSSSFATRGVEGGGGGGGVARTSSLLSLFEAQSVEHVPGGRGICIEPHDNSFEGPAGGAADSPGGWPGREREPLAFLDVMGGNTAGNYPWSDEKRVGSKERVGRPYPGAESTAVGGIETRRSSTPPKPHRTNRGGYFSEDCQTGPGLESSGEEGARTDPQRARERRVPLAGATDAGGLTVATVGRRNESRDIFADIDPRRGTTTRFADHTRDRHNTLHVNRGGGGDGASDYVGWEDVLGTDRGNRAGGEDDRPHPSHHWPADADADSPHRRVSVGNTSRRAAASKEGASGSSYRCDQTVDLSASSNAVHPASQGGYSRPDFGQQQPSPRNRRPPPEKELANITPTTASAPLTTALTATIGSAAVVATDNERAIAEKPNLAESYSRFSLWSSDDDEASVTVLAHDIDCGERGGANGFDEAAAADGRAALAACAEGGELYSVNNSAGSVVDCRDGRVETPATPPAARKREAFFDTATSSADKGRLKVRDPRLFDPCSMRRTTDVFKPPEQQQRVCGVGGDSKGCDSYDATAGASAGVTLLLGRRTDGSGRRQEEGSIGDEQVITVMFDRSKFNEQEARRWWFANRSRVVGI